MKLINILWITNTIFPEPSRALGIPETVYGGWTYGLVKQLSSCSSIHLGVATTYLGTDVKSFNIDNVIYYLLPTKSEIAYKSKLEPLWQEICSQFSPDVVHIFGTELWHGLACMRSCPSLNYIVSLQGLVGIYSRYYYGGISKWDIIKHITFHDLVKRNTLFHGKMKFETRGKFEKEYLQRVNHIIGRTSWDFAHAKEMNHNTTYHFCNEALRGKFYNEPKWDLTLKTNYTIFLSQAFYPIKGLHQVLKAVSLVKSDFPGIKIRVGGSRIKRNYSIIEKIKLDGYSAYIRTLINKLNLNEHVYFTGTLSEEKIIEEYMNAHLFICPSSIENSPNSLGEAQLLGVPTISAYVGGIPDMVIHNETGLLYRFEEIEMLAENIRRIFKDDNLAIKLSNKGISVAEHRHDRNQILFDMLQIYQGMLQ